MTLGWAPQGWGVAGLSVGTPGRAECGTQQGPGAETCWWDLGCGEQCQAGPASLRVCPLLPHTVSPPQWHCRVAWAPLLKFSRDQVTPGTKQLLSLSHNVQGECVFPRGNWSRNTGARRSCLVKIVNKSP